MQEWLIRLRGTAKRAIVAANDALILLFAIWLAFYLRLDRIVLPETSGGWVTLLAAPVLGMVGLRFAGVYRLIVRDMGADGLRRIALGLLGGAVAWGALAFTFSLSLNSVVFVPRTVLFGFLIIAFLLLAGSRAAAYMYFTGRSLNLESLFALNSKTPATRRTAVVVGYEQATPKVAREIARAGNYKIAGIIHDDPTMEHRKVGGYKIYGENALMQVIERNQVDEIFLLASKFSAPKRLEIIKSVGDAGVSVKHFPTFSDIETGRVNVSDLRPVNVMQLLGRDPVPPVEDLLTSAVRDKVVLITGAGGSIGSELARMTSGLGPRKIILFEVSETALYGIQQELSARAKAFAAGQDSDAPSDDLSADLSRAGESFPEVIGMLGSVTSETDLDTVFKAHDIDVVYHAAAYKHVPIVEHNMAAGVRNNTFGTRLVARKANEAEVDQFIMISTDKAVRPTNVMGASKRLAEIVLQGIASDPATTTRYSMVRFGNVLGSSGSVVPLFQEQIAGGGPITVTHPDIVRYFMSIPEAVQLVIQSGAMAEQGALYVLDMGEPVRIVDLAKAMINLAGLTERTPENPSGDIEIRFVGLREGEKLYEELLIDGNSVVTRHERIRRQVEPVPGSDELAQTLRKLEHALDTPDSDHAVQKLLMDLVEEYKPWPSKDAHKVVPFRQAI